MKELVELNLSNQLILKENLVKGAILPRNYNELEREVIVKGETIVEGALYAKTLLIEQGPLTVKGAVFSQQEIHVSSGCKGLVEFQKSVGSTESVTCLSPSSQVRFCADIHGRSISLRNCYVAANIFGDNVTLENCVVLGGVFAIKSLAMTNCLVGTFHSPSVRIAQEIYLLLPSAFSVEPISSLPGSKVTNLALADLGALMKGIPEKTGSGKIPMQLDKEEQRTDLVDTDGNSQVVRSYSIATKVLLADMLDLDKLQNHFLLAAGSLGAQTLRRYDLGEDATGQLCELNPATISEFFFKVLQGQIEPRSLDSTFSFADIVNAFGAVPA